MSAPIFYCPDCGSEAIEIKQGGKFFVTCTDVECGWHESISGFSDLSDGLMGKMEQGGEL